ncbi:MAG: nicotinate-nucleotide--dimethylbenzimidazole phosphoribosyltransferase, partial [bacterium]
MAITQRPRPDVRRKRICVFAGDHGVCAEGVSAYPPAVTSLMVGNFLRGGAAAGLPVVVDGFISSAAALT